MGSKVSSKMAAPAARVIQVTYLLIFNYSRHLRVELR